MLQYAGPFNASGLFDGRQDRWRHVVLVDGLVLPIDDDEVQPNRDNSSLSGSPSGPDGRDGPDGHDGGQSGGPARLQGGVQPVQVDPEGHGQQVELVQGRGGHACEFPGENNSSPHGGVMVHHDGVDGGVGHEDHLAGQHEHGHQVVHCDRDELGASSYQGLPGGHGGDELEDRGLASGEAGHVGGGVTPPQHSHGRVQDEALQLLSPLSPGSSPSSGLPSRTQSPVRGERPKTPPQEGTPPPSSSAAASPSPIGYNNSWPRGGMLHQYQQAWDFLMRAPQSARDLVMDGASVPVSSTF